MDILLPHKKKTNCKKNMAHNYRSFIASIKPKQRVLSKFGTLINGF